MHILTYCIVQATERTKVWWPNRQLIWTRRPKSPQSTEEPHWNPPRWLVRRSIQNHIFYSQVLTRIVQEQPEGYPRLAALLDSDESFMLYRRFGYLQARLLLDRQDELRALELRLDRLDTTDANNKPDGPNMLRSRAYNAVTNPARKRLLDEIEAKFKDYGRFYSLFD